MRYALPGFLALLPLVACQSSEPIPEEFKAVETADSKKKGDEPDLSQLEHDVDSSRRKLENARLEKEGALEKSERELEHARMEVDLAQADLDNFMATQKPSRVARATLDLQGARDRAQEAKDELAQIEIMYDEQDLDDLTAEFVVSRGRRSAERAAARIQIQEADFANLQDHTLVQEEVKLRMALERKHGALTQAERSVVIAANKHEISVGDAEFALAKAEEKLAEAKGADDGEGAHDEDGEGEHSEGDQG